MPGVDISIILINDGSKQDLSDGLNQLKEKYPEKISIIENSKNQGKGFSIRKGMGISTASLAIYTDVDFPYTTSSLVDLYHTLVNGDYDVSLGIRDTEYYDEIPNSRKKMSLLLKSANQKLLKLITSDTQTGLKGMNQKGKSILLETKENRYLIDLEYIKLLSKRSDIKIKLQTVKLREGVVFSKVPVTKILGEARSYLKILFG